MTYHPPQFRRGFTLIEIMIVIIILGILAAIVIPQMTDATTLSRANTLHEEVHFMREQIEAFKYQHTDISPGYPSGNSGQTPDETDFVNQMVGNTDVACNIVTTSAPGSYGPYLSAMPTNPVNGKVTVLVLDNSAALPTAASGDYGWVYQPSTLTFKSDAVGTDQSGVDYFNY